MRTIVLTSPPTRGPSVDRCQRILTNRGYFVGTIDGVFGETTGRACSEAKYKLGYASKNIVPSYGNDLERFLTGMRRPTPAMRVRASQRRKRMSFGTDAVRIAKRFIGTKERPANSNRVMFSEWYGIIGPWCVMFVTYCFVEAKSKAFKKGERWASCEMLLADATSSADNGVVRISKQQAGAGDLALYSWHGDGVANHVGIMLTPVDHNGSFTAVEGNTSISNNSNGGEVMVRHRNAHDVIGYVRVTR